MDKYLKLLLEIENTIIIPGLGALMVRNDSTKELMFNEYLKFNDGKLDKFIAENSTMDEQEAKNFVAKYVREIQAKLGVGESYDMFEFGSFAKDKEGKVEFIPWNNNSTNTATQNTVDTSENDKQLKEEKENAKKTVEEAEKIKKEKKAAQEKVAQEKIKAEQEEVQKKNIYIPPSVDTKSEEHSLSSEKNNETKVEAKIEAIETEEKISPEKSLEDLQEAKKEKRKRKGIFFWVLLVLLLIIAVGGIFAGLNYEKVKHFMGWNQEVLIETPQTTPINDSVIETENDVNSIHNDLVEDSILNSSDTNNLESSEIESEETSDTEDTASSVIETTEENNVPNSTEPQVKSEGNYHIVGGSFGNEANADRLVQEMRAKGYDSKILGKFGSLTTVVIQSYDSRQSAQEALNTVREDVDGAYVMKHPK